VFLGGIFESEGIFGGNLQVLFWWNLERFTPILRFFGGNLQLQGSKL